MGAPDLRLGRYGLGATSGTTAATANHCLGSFWNPHATKGVYLVLFTFSKTAQIVNLYAERISARGTPGSTVTPDIDNDFDRLLAPVSGAVLDLAAFSVQPTRSGPSSMRFVSQNNPGPTIEWYFGEDGLLIPAGTGLGVFTETALASSGSLSAIWDE
jgi:hypothetical protein